MSDGPSLHSRTLVARVLFIISILAERRTHGQLNLTAQNPVCAIKNKDKFAWLRGSYFLGATKTTTGMQRDRMYAPLHENYIEYTAKSLGWGTCEMVPKSPSWGNRAGRRLRIADDLFRGQLWISWWDKSNTVPWTETPVNKQSRTASGYFATKQYRRCELFSRI